MLRDIVDVVKEERERLSRARTALLDDWKRGKIVNKLEHLAAKYSWASLIARAAKVYFPQHEKELHALNPDKIEAICKSYDWYLDNALFRAEQACDDACLTLRVHRNTPYFRMHPQG